MAKGYNLDKNFLKNGYLFSLKYIKEKDFGNDLMILDAKWPSSYRKKPLGVAHLTKDLHAIRKKDAEALKLRKKFINNDDDKLMAITTDINYFISKHNLGDEWFFTIVDYLISRWLHVPEPNISVKEAGRRVELILNPDTSLDDIKAIWPIIQKKQMKLWPNCKKNNFSKKMFKNLSIAMQDLIEKAKNKGSELDAASGRKYKIKDLDLVSKIWENEKDNSEEADRKKVPNLRQIRKRFLDKLA